MKYGDPLIKMSFLKENDFYRLFPVHYIIKCNISVPVKSVKLLMGEFVIHAFQLVSSDSSNAKVLLGFELYDI